MKLNKSDYQLIQQLLLNSRTPLTQLGKRIRKSRENTTHALNRLVKSGLIKSFYGIINTELLGYRQYSVFLKLINSSKQKEKEIVNFLKNQECVGWIGLLVGKWNMTFDIYAKDEKELTCYVNHLLSQYGAHIKEHLEMRIASKEYFYNKIFGFENPIVQKENFEKIVKLDDTDLKILKLVNQNSRVTYAEISIKSGLTANAIKKRMQQLKLKKIIRGYSILIEPKILELDWYGLQLKLLRFDETTTQKTRTFLEKHQNVAFFYTYDSGVWNYDVGILVQNQSDFRNFLIDLESQLGDSAQLSDFFFVLKEITENRLPEKVFKIRINR